MERATKVSYILLFSYIALLLISRQSQALGYVALAVLLAFLLSLLANTVNHVRTGKPKDIWKLGWIGALGFLGFVPGLGTAFFGIYGFYVFFGFKKSK